MLTRRSTTNVSMCLVAVLGTCSSCFCADYGSTWTAAGRIVTAGTSNTVSDATVHAVARWHEPSEAEGWFGGAPDVTSPDGSFASIAASRLSGTCGPFNLPVPPTRPIGQAPDEIMLTVTTADGSTTELLLEVTEDMITERDGVSGVDLWGTIDLGDVPVSFE